jgi:hypothetical protein
MKVTVIFISLLFNTKMKIVLMYNKDNDNWDDDFDGKKIKIKK